MNYWRVEAASPELKVSDIDFNISEILRMSKNAEKKGTKILVFPELSITGYTCGDLFGQSLLLDKVLSSVETLKEKLPKEMLVVVGAPIRIESSLYNCALCFLNGALINITVKTVIPNYKEFYEKRWFHSASDLTVAEVEINGNLVPLDGIMELRCKEDNSTVKVGVEICEDLWVPNPPSSNLALAGADIILNPSASNETIDKNVYRENLIKSQSARCISAYVYSSAGMNESVTDLVFSGICCIAENGRILCKSELFNTKSTSISMDVDVEILRNERLNNVSFGDNKEQCYGIFPEISLDISKNNKDILRKVTPHPFVPDTKGALKERCLEVTDIQITGLARRLKHIGCKDVVIGISGGLDSTLALLVTCRAFDTLGISRKGVHGITMPGLGTSETTKTIADDLMEALGISSHTINISEAATQHLKDIDHPLDNYNVVYENAQARERTQILMDFSNKIGGIVIGTGDLSELAIGWCTYNGDHMSMYGINCSIPKTLIKYLVNGYKEIFGKEVGEILENVTNIPISPELLPPDATGDIAQKTEDIVGPYELHDFFIYHMIRHGEKPDKILKLASIAFDGVYDDETIKKWYKIFIRRFFASQFKRSCIPDGPKVGSVSLSPRGDWRMPSDASMELWLSQLE